MSGNPVPMIFRLTVTIASVLAGAIASIAGFGIGSILTPLLAAGMATKLAVAVVSVPHFVGTSLRLALFRKWVNRKVLLTFGVTSAAGGLGGALLHVWLSSSILGHVLGALLVFAGLAGIAGMLSRMRFRKQTAWAAGALSGVFGGLVGNQGGIRSAALFGFDLPSESFVATGTAIALLVDVFRMPVYGLTQMSGIASQGELLILATAGVVTGTLVGRPLLRRIPENAFRIMVSAIILALGIWMFVHPGA